MQLADKLAVFNLNRNAGQPIAVPGWTQICYVGPPSEYYSGPWFGAGASCGVGGQAGPLPSEAPESELTWALAPHPAMGGAIAVGFLRDVIHPGWVAGWWSKTDPDTENLPGWWPKPIVAPVPRPWRSPVEAPIAKPVPVAEPLPYRLRGLDYDPAFREIGPVARPLPRERLLQVTERRPPGEGVKERKFNSRLRAVVFIGVNGLTETWDGLECMWKGLPAKLRKPVLGRKLPGMKTPTMMPPYTKQQIKDLYSKHGKAGAQAIMAANPKMQQYKAGRPVHQMPSTMLEDLYKYWNHVDWAEVQACWSQNKAVDKLIGKSAAEANKGFLSRNPGRPLGLGAGEAL